MRRLAPLALVLLLTACDSGDPDGSRSGDLVGTWGLVATETAAEITTDVAQSYIALDGVGSSTVEGTGDAAVRLPFAQRQFEDDDRADYVFTSFDPAIGPDFNEPFQVLTVRQFQTTYDADLEVYTPQTGSRGYFNSGVRTVLASSGGTVTLQPIAVTSGNRIIQLSGTATFASVQLAAGVPTSVSLGRSAQEPGPLGVPRTRYTFERDGDWRGEFDFSPSGTDVALGTWEAQDGRLRIEVPSDPGEAQLQRFAFRVEAGTLSLDATQSECTTDGCLADRASQLGLSGRLTAYRSLRALAFEETEAPFAKPATPSDASKTSADAVWPWTGQR